MLAAHRFLPGVHVTASIWAGGGNAVTDFQRYDVASNTWDARFSHPDTTWITGGYPGMGAIAGKVYVAGGQGPGSLATTEVFDPATNAWSVLTSMPAIKSLGGYAVLNGLFYHFAGAGPGGANVTTVYRYDPATDIWSTLAVFPVSSWNYSTSDSYNGKVYTTAGAFTGSGTFSYDPSTNAWTTLTTPTTRVRQAMGGIIAGKLHVVGGLNSGGTTQTTHQVYDIAGNSWSTAAALPVGRCDGGSAVYDGKLYVVMGTTNNANSGKTSTIYIYDPASDSWSTSAAAPAANYKLRAAVTT